ncbi:hypothetical protein KA977_05925 [Candidatus Dependentiae bacterium]|nr:hypothetical protein [Candidatus Dependentiae bacterium]
MYIRQKKIIYSIFILFVFLVIFSCSKNKGNETSVSQPIQQQPEKKILNIKLVTLKADEYTDRYEKLLKEYLKKNGVIEGTDYNLKLLSAQNEITIIPTIIDSVVAEKADILLTFFPQVLYASIKKAPDIKKVFTAIVNPFLIGAGNSDTDHIPNLTGNYEVYPIEAMLDYFKECRPNAKRIGFIYNTSIEEDGYIKDEILKAAKQKNIEMFVKGYASTIEISDAANSLFSKKLDAVLHLPTSDFIQVLNVISKKAVENKIPVLSFGDKDLPQLSIMGIDEDETEKYSFAELVLKVIKGEDPGKIPFVNSKSARKFIYVNKKNIDSIGFKISESVLKKADKIIEK